MDSYLASGFGDEQFVPKGKKINGKREGKWKDYEVMKTFAYKFSNNEPKQEFGHFMVYGEGKFEDDKRDGLWKLFLIEDSSFKKILLMEVEYEKGKMNGNYIHYYTSGEVGMKGFFVNDLLEGEILSYFPNGNLYGKRFFRANKKFGKQIYFYPSGQIKFYHHFQNDTLNGKFKSFYPDGTLKEVFDIVKGKTDGIWKYYYPSSQLWMEKQYIMGKVMNIIGSYGPNGEERDHGTLKDGNGTVKYYTEEGEIYSILTYKNGEIVDEKKIQTDPFDRKDKR
ncbi:MAG: hypothetical protein MI810_17595 [Flavobacteriales bacterium]|nr:hypothetical protein [Flavobacteriales bacterium]